MSHDESHEPRGFRHEYELHDFLSILDPHRHLVMAREDAVNEVWLRTCWWEFLFRGKTPQEFRERFTRTFDAALRRLYDHYRDWWCRETPDIVEGALGHSTPPADTDNMWPQLQKFVHQFRTFEELLRSLKTMALTRRGQAHIFRSLAEKIDEFRSRIAPLSQSMISSICGICPEYVLWLKKHPNSVTKWPGRHLRSWLPKYSQAAGFASISRLEQGGAAPM